MLCKNLIIKKKLWWLCLLFAAFISHARCPPGQEGHDAQLSGSVSPLLVRWRWCTALLMLMEADLRRPIGAPEHRTGPGRRAGACQGERQLHFSRCRPSSPKTSGAAQPAPTHNGDAPSWPHALVLDNRVSLIAGQGLGQGGARGVPRWPARISIRGDLRAQIWRGTWHNGFSRFTAA